MPILPFASLALAAHVAIGGAAPVEARPADVAAQTTDAREARVIRGEVLDAASGLPLAGSTVVLRLVDEGAITPAHSGGSFIATGRAVTTGADGSYRFAELSAGRYQLHVQRLGYRPATIEVELHAESGSHLSVGLSVAAIRLTALEVEAEGQAAFQAPAGGMVSADSLRLRAVRERQRRYATTDAREVTEADLMEAVTLGETDLFRALHRLPGVTPRNDYTAELWTRGTRWDRTRVYLDGLPLFAPLHGYGELTGIGTDVVGGAVLFPGVAPASVAEGSAALDLRSRGPVPDGDLRGVAELTLLNARLALARGAADGSGGWSVAGRRQFTDLWYRAKQKLGGMARTPNYYDDLTAQWEHALPGGWRLESSGLYSRDQADRVPSDTLAGPPLEARNTAARITLAAPVGDGRWTTRYTLGASRYDADQRYLKFVLDPGPGPATASAPYRTGSTVDYLTLSGEIAPASGAAAGTEWRAGWALEDQGAALTGHVAAELLGDTSHVWTARYASLRMLGLWGERQWIPGDGLRIDGGLRADVGGAIAGAGRVRLAPRLRARVLVDSQTTISAALGRSYQYAQVLTRAETTVPVMRLPMHLWALADESMPALRSDVLTVGLERWAGAAVLLGANAYLRHATGVAVPDPTPGVHVERPFAAVAEENARGLELSARKLAGRATGMVAYTLASTRLTAGGYEYPASQDRRQSIDATLLLRATSRIQLGAAYGQATGSPYTMDYRLQSPQGQTTDMLGAPNAQRAPNTWGVDLLADWSGRAWGANTSVFLQLRNVLVKGDPDTYWSGRPCVESVPGCVSRDYYEGHVSAFTPVLGVRLAF